MSFLVTRGARCIFRHGCDKFWSGIYVVWWRLFEPKRTIRTSLLWSCAKNRKPKIRLKLNFNKVLWDFFVSWTTGILSDIVCRARSKSLYMCPVAIVKNTHTHKQKKIQKILAAIKIVVPISVCEHWPTQKLCADKTCPFLVGPRLKTEEAVSLVPQLKNMQFWCVSCLRCKCQDALPCRYNFPGLENPE